MVPILTRYGPFFLYSYTVIISLGLLAALGLTAWQARSRNYPDWIDAALIMFAGAVAGGRIVFVGANWEYFQVHRGEIGQLWLGGLAYHGCLLGGLAALYGWAKWRRRRFLVYGDLFAPAIALLALFAWPACWLEGCAYGRETVAGLLAGALPDTFGVTAMRYQTQLLGMLVALGSFAIVWALRNRLRTGKLFWLTLCLLSFSQAVVGIWRGDLVAVVGSVPLAVLVDLLAGVVAALCLLLAGRGPGDELSSGDH